MSTALKIAQLYFALSNKSDFDGIGKLFTDKTVYKSQNTGEYIGVTDILTMQRAFHGKFSSLNWKVNSVREIKPGVILFDYELRGELASGEVTTSTGLEYVTVNHGKIQEIEIENK